MCQTCVDEGYLSQKTLDKIDAFIHQWPNAAYGPAHIVLDDANILDEHINWCLGLIIAVQTGIVKDGEDAELLNNLDWYQDHSAEELEATRLFLNELLVTPEDIR